MNVETPREFVRTKLEPLLEEFSRRPVRPGYLPFDETVALIEAYIGRLVTPQK